MLVKIIKNQKNARRYNKPYLSFSSCFLFHLQSYVLSDIYKPIGIKNDIKIFIKTYETTDLHNFGFLWIKQELSPESGLCPRNYL